MTYTTSLPYPTHDIVLADDQGNELGVIAVNAKGEHDPASIVRTPVERSSLKMSQGNQSYSDLQPPYTVLAQNEWGGGRGGRTFEDDTTRFYSSCRAETGRAGKIILSGRETYGMGYRTVVENGPGAMRMIPLLGAQSQLAVKLTTVGGFTLDKVLLWIAYVGAPGDISVSLCADTAGAPGAAAQTVTLARTALQMSILSEPVIFDFNTALAAATSYWIVVTAANDTTKYWKVGVSETAGLTKESADGTTWTASAYDMYYRAMDNTAEMDGEFFEYEDEEYFVTKPTAGASQLWRVSGSVWSDVTPGAMTAIVTDVVVTNKMVIFAFGASLAMIGMRKNGANLETFVDTGQTAQFIEMYNDEGTVKLVKTLGTVVSSANEPVWGIQPAWTDIKQVGKTWEAITGLAKYANDSGAETMIVMKESGPWEYDGDAVHNLSHDEMKAVASMQLGKVARKSDVYLWMSVMNTVWRFYSPTFDDVGFMLDDGLPFDMRGVVSCILPYPGRTLVAVDAGATGYSSILENKGGSAWHEKYRAPKGERIFNMDIQVTAGLGRLWVRQGADFMYLPLPGAGFDPKQDADYPYQHEGMVELGDMYGGLQDAWKYWSTLKLQLEDLEDNVTWIEADFKLDDGEWTPLPTAFTEMPIEEKAFGVTDAEGRTFGVSSKKFKLRVRLYSRSLLKSPTVWAIIIEAVTVTAPKFTYSMVAKIGNLDLNYGSDKTLEAWEKMQLLDTWSGTAQSLWMRCINPLFDGKPVFLAPLSNRPLMVSEHEGEFEYTTTITLQEA